MPLFESRDSRDARARVSELHPQLVQRLLDSGNRLQDVRFRADRVVQGQLAEGDVDQLTDALQQAEENLDAGRRALPILEQFAASGQLDGGAFHALKTCFLEEDENPNVVAFDHPWDAALWLANRASEFADYLESTQLPWLERSLEEVRTGGDAAGDQAQEADAGRRKAAEALDEFSRQFPDLRLAHAINLKRDLDGAWARLQERQRDRVQSEIAAAAQDVIELSEDLQNTVSEAGEFRQNASAKAAEGRDFVDGLQQAFRHARLGVPPEAQEAAEALDGAVAEARKAVPDWNEAVRLYIHASNLAAEAADRLPEGTG